MIDVLIIGGGSAGMAAAITACENGSKVTIVEKDDFLGGILLQCIHNGFGLHTFKEELSGPEYASRFEEMVIKKDIDVLLKTMVLGIEKTDGIFYVSVSSMEDGFRVLKAKAIIATTGAMERTRGQIQTPGDRPSGVITAGLAQKYLNIDGYLAGKRVFILGSGDIGLIMARRMTLEGAKVLGVAELMPYSNGLNRNIVQCLNDYNIPLYLSHTVSKIIGKDRLEAIEVTEVNDKLEFIEGTTKRYEVDTLLLSVGLVPYNTLLKNVGVKMNPKTKGPIVDEYFETSVEGLFSAGNSLHVHDLVDFVTEEAGRAGTNASNYVKGINKKDLGVEVTNGVGVGYIIPSKFYLDNKEDVTFNFRVKVPFNNVYVVIKQNGNIIRKIKRAYMLPAEMESIKISKDLFTTTDLVSVEVSND